MDFNEIEYINIILENSYSLDLIVSEDLKVLFFNKKAGQTFRNIAKNISINCLFDSKEVNEVNRLISYLNTNNLDIKSNYIFNLNNRYFNIKIKLIKDIYYLSFNDIFDEYMLNALNSINTGIALTDPNLPNNPAIFVNDYFCTSTGYSKEDVIGKNLNILKSDESDYEEREKIKSAIKNKKSIITILKNKTKNLDTYYNKVSISPIINKDTNRLQFFMGIQSNITDELKEKNFFEMVLNTTKSIIIVKNKNGIKRINKMFFEIFDYENLDDFKSKHKYISELFIKEESYLQHDYFGMQWNRYILETPEKLHEVKMLDKFGVERIFQVQSSGKIFNDEEVITLTDITQLNKQKDMLNEQSKFAAMGEMISMIAHQWRQPLSTLTVILDKLNLLRQIGTLDEKRFLLNYKKSMEIINYMSKTIDDFRNFFNNEDKNEEITLYELINSSFRLINSSFRSSGVISEIIFEDECKFIVLNINSSKLTQVLLNLFKNSLDEFVIKKIKDPYLKIRCFMKKNEICIEVADNAGGIPNEILSKIFEPYFTTKSKNGTGIGLYMSKIIIEEHIKGSLKVLNNDFGATFLICIPILRCN